MASVVARKNKAGAIISYQVKWRLGGGREAPWQTERFDDVDSADIFKTAVNEHGQQWPPGWVRGRGFIGSLGGSDNDRYRFRQYATTCIENRTGIEEQYRTNCHRDLDKWIFPTFGECDVRSTDHFSSETIRAWVRGLEKSRVHSGPAPKSGMPKLRKMSPKTIRNMHALLSSILQEAVEAEPPLRARNPCELTRLPRKDDDGVEGEDIEFLTPEEVAGLIAQMQRRTDQLLTTVKYGTGLRWSEITALTPACLIDWSTSAPKIRVKRAWKKDGMGGFYLGVPKSKRSRRTVRVPPSVVAAVEELGGRRLEHDQLFFTGDRQQRLSYSTFDGRWKRAVRLAREHGLVPPQKRPTPHDLRHSHAAVLISEGRSLTYVQRRLGHESIKTTSDTYGHLLPQADDDAMETIERALSHEVHHGSEARAASML
ncbi:tyrosine-type recombinase/integrase [Streptomyces sp. NPDC001953]